MQAQAVTDARLAYGQYTYETRLHRRWVRAATLVICLVCAIQVGVVAFMFTHNGAQVRENKVRIEQLETQVQELSSDG